MVRQVGKLTVAMLITLVIFCTAHYHEREARALAAACGRLGHRRVRPAPEVVGRPTGRGHRDRSEAKHHVTPGGGRAGFGFGVLLGRFGHNLPVRALEPIFAILARRMWQWEAAPASSRVTTV